MILLTPLLEEHHNQSLLLAADVTISAWKILYIEEVYTKWFKCKDLTRTCATKISKKQAERGAPLPGTASQAEGAPPPLVMEQPPCTDATPIDS